MFESVTGEKSQPWSVKSAPWPVYDLFDTRDGTKIFVSIVGEEHWQGFCRAFGRESWLSDPRLATSQGRVDQRGWVIPEIAGIFATWEIGALSKQLEQLDLPFAPVNTPSDLFDDPHLLASGGLLDVTLPSGVHARTPALPISIDGKRLQKRRDPPKIGEHTGEVLANLDYSAAEIAIMIRDGTAGLTV